MQINHLPNRRRLGNCKNSKFFHLCLHYLIFNAYYLTHIFTPLRITIKKKSFKNLVDLIVSVEPCEFTFCKNCSEHGHLSNSSCTWARAILPTMPLLPCFLHHQAFSQTTSRHELSCLHGLFIFGNSEFYILQNRTGEWVWKQIFLNSTFISHAYPDLEITKTKCHPFLSCLGTL